jgi:hypothetical protein
MSCPSNTDHFSSDTDSKNPQFFNESELNDLVRDLVLTKENTELFGSRLKKKKNLLAPETIFYWYRNRQEEFIELFIKEGELVYCCLIHRLGAYETDDWRLFIDSFKRSLMAVLQNNERLPAPVPVAHTSSLKGSHENCQKVLEKN